MDQSRRVWILGAGDPEMAEIEYFLVGAKEAFVHATAGGEPVTPGNAYRADIPDNPDYARIVGRGGEIYLVECAIKDPRLGGDSSGETDCAAVGVRVDHQKAGDPGYGRPPAEFLSASSLGQVLLHLARIPGMSDNIPFPEVGVEFLAGWSAPGRSGDCPCRREGTDNPHQPAEEEDAWDALRHSMAEEDACPPEGFRWAAFRRGTVTSYGPGWALYRPDEKQWMAVGGGPVIVAAADHCLAAAYRGECPGVKPEQLARWREQTRAKFQGRSVADVRRDVDLARAAILESSRDREYADLRDRDIPELPEAAVREGIAFLASVKERGRSKVVLQAASPDLVRRFLAGELVPGLTDLYGDPARGFAGGYSD